MKIYILTRKDSNFTKSFISMSLLIDAVKDINEDHFDGVNFGTNEQFKRNLFPKSHKLESYFIDSITLGVFEGNNYNCTTFFIQCIDSTTKEIYPLNKYFKSLPTV